MGANAQPIAEDREHIVRIAVDQLLLDPQNPRISASPDAGQEELLKILYETQALDELAFSFERSGFFLEEPVVVVPTIPDPTKFIVVEGNRRIATIKILLGDDLRKKLGASDWPSLNAGRRTELAKIPTVRYARREDVVPYLGFRHITGIKTWDPFAKARYVAALLDSGRSAAEIEELVGDRARTVKRLYQAFVVYRQATEDLGLEKRVIENTFSLLEVALSQAAIKAFLSLPKKLPDKKVDTVVPDDRSDQLRELVSWVFGDSQKRQERIITDSRQIPSRLAPVLDDPESLGYLRRTRDLEGAYEYSGGEKQVLLRHLAATRRAGQRALGILPGYLQDEEVATELRGLQPTLQALIESTNP